MKATQKKLQKKPGKHSKDLCKHRCIKTLVTEEYECGPEGTAGFESYPMVVWCKSCGALGQLSVVNRMEWTLPKTAKK